MSGRTHTAAPRINAGDGMEPLAVTAARDWVRRAERRRDELRAAIRGAEAVEGHAEWHGLSDAERTLRVLRFWTQEDKCATGLASALNRHAELARHLAVETRRPACPASQLDKLAKAERSEAITARRAAREALRLGLSAREGRYLREPLTLDTFQQLWRLAGRRLPAGVAVCQVCGHVFRPQRKSRATTCPDCHGNARPFGIEALEGGGYFTTVPPTARAQSGLPSRGSRPCPVCGKWFEVKRRDHVTCGGRGRCTGAADDA